MNATPTLTAASRSVRSAAALHRDLLERFMDRIERRIAAATDPFVRDSLLETLDDLREQRDTYPAPLGVAEAVAA